MVIKKSNSAFNCGATQRVRYSGRSSQMFIGERILTPSIPPLICIRRALYTDVSTERESCGSSPPTNKQTLRYLKEAERLPFETLNNFDNAEAILGYCLCFPGILSLHRPTDCIKNELHKQDCTVIEVCKDLLESRRNCSIDSANAWKIVDRVRDIQNSSRCLSSILPYADLVVTEHCPTITRRVDYYSTWSAYDTLSDHECHSLLDFTWFVSPTGIVRTNLDWLEKGVRKSTAPPSRTRALRCRNDSVENCKRTDASDSEGGSGRSLQMPKGILCSKRSSTRGLQRPAMWDRSSPSKSKKKIARSSTKEELSRPREVIHISLITPMKTDARDLNVNFVIKKLGHQPYNEPRRSTYKRKSVRKRTIRTLRDEIQLGREHHRHDEELLDAIDHLADSDFSDTRINVTACYDPELDQQAVHKEQRGTPTPTSSYVLDLQDLVRTSNRNPRKFKCHRRRHLSDQWCQLDSTGDSDQNGNAEVDLRERCEIFPEDNSSADSSASNVDLQEMNPRTESYCSLSSDNDSTCDWELV